jgi:pyruvate ferredoxin oxidoreductase beta subunit
MRHVTKAAGKNTIVVQATGCMEVVSTPYPQTAWKLPWIHCAFENVPAVASGIDAALAMQGKRDKINILALGGDGASFDIGFGALSGAIERGHKFTYIATDNEAYMNTGVQRSGATLPYQATTTSPAGKKIHGKQEPKKPLPLIIASHGVRYVATMSVSDIMDMHRKVKEALQTPGPTFLHALNPCPLGWYHKAEQTIEIAKLAVETRVFPLYEIKEGVLTFTQRVDNPKPVEEYLTQQGRFKHLTEEEIKKMQAYVNARYEFLMGIEGKKAFDVLF